MCSCVSSAVLASFSFSASCLLWPHGLLLIHPSLYHSNALSERSRRSPPRCIPGEWYVSGCFTERSDSVHVIACEPFQPWTMRRASQPKGPRPFRSLPSGNAVAFTQSIKSACGDMWAVSSCSFFAATDGMVSLSVVSPIQTQREYVHMEPRSEPCMSRIFVKPFSEVV